MQRSSDYQDYVLIRNRRKCEKRINFNPEKFKAYLRANKNIYDKQTTKMLQQAANLFLPMIVKVKRNNSRTHLKSNLCTRGNCNEALDEQLGKLEIMNVPKPKTLVYGDAIEVDLHQTREDIFANIVYESKLRERIDPPNISSDERASDSSSS